MKCSPPRHMEKNRAIEDYHSALAIQRSMHLPKCASPTPSLKALKSTRRGYRQSIRQLRIVIRRAQPNHTSHT
jgi:hypothetical protein